MPLGDTPQQKQSYSLELVGSAYSPDGISREDDLKWYSNIQAYLGDGSYIMINNLVPGEHIISLIASDGLGGECRAEFRTTINE